MQRMSMKRMLDVIFIIIVALMLGLPYLFADRSQQGVSAQENRNLSPAASLFKDGKFNFGYPKEYEAWFADHLGFRTEMINYNGWMDYYLFDKFPDSSDIKLGRDGALNYATPAIVSDYARTNLRSAETVAQIGEAYQKISDWTKERGTQFYLVQCVDKHTIYPEQFLDGVNQFGEVSKTDQVMTYLKEHTDVRVLYMKEVMSKAKDDGYEVYSYWSDPTHWTQRGAFIGYTEIMSMLNKYNDDRLSTLTEADYAITTTDMGSIYYDRVHREDMLENFAIQSPNASKEADLSGVEGMIADYRHSIWKNSHAGNDLKLMIMGDSYVNSFIIDDLAESFAETWMVWGDYTGRYAEVVEAYQPDIVIYECAERVDRSGAVVSLAGGL